MKDRIERLQNAIRASHVDLVAIGPTTNMRYLAGYTPHPDERLCLLLISADKVKVVMPALNAEDWQAHVSIEPITWDDSEGPARALRAALSDLTAPRRLAFDGATRADFLIPLLSLAKPEEVLPAGSLIAPLRIRKSPAEIEALRAAAAQADRAMQVAMAACEPGVTEAEVAWETEAAFRRDGAESVEFTLIASGPNGAFPHHHSGERRLQKGDAIIIDIGASLNGYKSDITRMVFLGEPSPDFRAAYAAVLAANEAGRAAVRPGVTAQDIDRATRGVLNTAGYGEYFVHRTGHGIGMDVHEAPWLMEGNEEVLAPGMTFSVEPGVYLPGRFGVRIEDIVVVTETGVRTLTGSDHQLVIKQ
ncbi:MAG: aminopeptidase P family protein [Chloroflexi bacterium]|nr:aminopeptidase P family protein [Chloroflexota bacterium]